MKLPAARASPVLSTARSVAPYVPVMFATDSSTLPRDGPLLGAPGKPGSGACATSLSAVRKSSSRPACSQALSVLLLHFPPLL